MSSLQSRKARKVVVQPLLIATFAIKIVKRKIICILKQSAVAVHDGVSIQGKYKRGRTALNEETEKLKHTVCH